MLHASRMLDTVIVCTAISACQKGRSWGEALCLLLEISRGLLRSSIISYNAATNACKDDRTLEQAHRLLGHVRTHGSQVHLCYATSHATVSVDMLGTEQQVAG